jgi:hypothetical protein
MYAMGIGDSQAIANAFAFKKFHIVKILFGKDLFGK